MAYASSVTVLIMNYIHYQEKNSVQNQVYGSELKLDFFVLIQIFMKALDTLMWIGFG